MLRYLVAIFLPFLIVSCVEATEQDSDLSNTPDFSIKETVIKSGDLSGLYINAGENAPIILIVPGSGPTDLNGNNSFGINANVYKLLAEGLAQNGISTIRVDKRGMFSSEKTGDPNAVTLDIYAQDYRNWVKTAQSHTGQPCIYLLGHSEGALMVSAAAINNDDVCGLILVSGAGRPMGDVLREQLKANPANLPILKQAFNAIEKIEHGENVDESKLHKALRPLFAPQVQGFLISIMSVDPSEIAAKAQKDTIVIHGINDLQTSVEDAQRLADATGGYLVLIDGVNHVLKEAPKSRRKNFATYKDPDLPISESVIEAIRIFVFQ